MDPSWLSLPARPDVDQGTEQAPWPTRLYTGLLLVTFAFMPIWGVFYLSAHHEGSIALIHGRKASTIFAIGAFLAALNGLFMTAVTGQTYRERGEPFLKWLMLGFLSFSLLYAPQGMFGVWTGGFVSGADGAHSSTDVNFFQIYGPVSRLAVVLCLFIGLWRFGVEGRPRSRADVRRSWLLCVITVLGCVGVTGWAAMRWSDAADIRRVLDSTVLAIALAGLLPIAIRGVRASLIMLYAVSLIWLAQAAAAFLMARPWDDLWWYGQLVQAGGMLILGYGAVNAFHTLRVYDGIYSKDEILRHLRAEKRKAEDALAQLRIANEELSRLATTDALTGVSNRRQFMKQLTTEIARSKRTGSPLSLLMLDLDHFKSINDRYGHPTGDRVLKAFADMLQASVRIPDLVGRLGGEEFAVMLPDTGYVVALGVAERLREACAAILVEDQGQAIRFTTSIGIGQFGRDGETADLLINWADRRLYQAKKAGRNKIQA